MKNIILCIVNAGMLFGVWLIASAILSTGDEWWSLYTLNMEELSPFNVEISLGKVFVFGFISLVISFFLVKLYSEKEKF